MLTPDQKAVQKLAPNDKPAPDAAQRKLRRLDTMKQRTILSDCVVMLRYAFESCRLPTTLIDDIPKIDAILVAAGDEPLSQRPESLIPKPGGAQTQPEAAAQPQTGPPKAPVESQSSPSIDHLQDGNFPTYAQITCYRAGKFSRNDGLELQRLQCTKPTSKKPQLK